MGEKIEDSRQLFRALAQQFATQNSRINELEENLRQLSLAREPNLSTTPNSSDVPRPSSTSELSAFLGASTEQTPQIPSATLQEQLEQQLFPLAYALSDAYDFDPIVRHPKDLESRDALQEGASLLAQSALSDRALLRYIGGGEHVMFGPMATEALLIRGVDLFDEVCVQLRDLEERGLHFALKYLQASQKEQKISPVLVQTSHWWAQNDAICLSLRTFLQCEIQAHGVPTFSQKEQAALDGVKVILGGLLPILDIPGLQTLTETIKQPPSERVNRSFLTKIGRIWEPDADRDMFVTCAHNQQILERMEAILTGPARRSVVLLGKHGVGKTVTIHQLFHRLLARGWLLFEASAADVLAGQRYVGELEGRVRQLLDVLKAPKKVIWYVPDFHDLLEKGATQQDPTGILDLILPAMEKQQILLIGETRSEPYVRLTRARHKLRYVVEAITLDSADLEQTVYMAREWAKQMAERYEHEIVEPRVIEEAVQLSLQYFADQSLPGSIMQLLHRTFQRKLMALDGAHSLPLGIEDLLETIANLTHLPATVLDDRQRLDIEALRELFHQYVIGQDEAVECLIDRISMIKAGLTDPSRPLGVFFFAGPTGTGKTEMAKTLCRFLFGSEQHMLRLDMSEYNDRDSHKRLLQEGDGHKSRKSLASQIREQPFSVVLLDEVEKAHPQIWDLFLQVFDDGRLTDQGGDTVDFRHSIIILTSNVGSTIPKGSGVGFNTSQELFVPNSVAKAIEQTFRREFVNRIDRIVVFNPLNRGVMRDILHKELNGLLQRRGFRSKNWTVEWGASAVDFLLEKGFTPDLGARPLKRAIERYLLVPLSKTIVEHRFPEGNQFLFVRSDGQQIQVQFIDPDVPKEETVNSLLTTPPIRELSLKNIAFGAEGREEELVFLEKRCDGLGQQLLSLIWTNEKSETQTRMNEDDFLHAPDRYQILGRLEFMDRVEAGVESSRGLLRRLRAATDFGAQKESFEKLSQQLYLLEMAARDVLRDTPQNSLIYISGLPSKELPIEASFDVFQHVKKMYQGWAERRRMRSMWLKRGSLEKMQAIFAVSGLAAWSILQTEQGLHVFELPREDGTFHPTRVRVRVSPQPTEQASSNQSILTYATDFFSQEVSASKTICRHYRWAPTPLVHDRVHEWRTSEIARVLAGDFDLLD